MGELIAALLACAAPASPEPTAPEPVAEPAPAAPTPVFTAWPGCELSAIAALGDDRVVVGDNEVKNRLAVVAIDDSGRLDPATARWLPIEREEGDGWDGLKVEDIEALTWLGDQLVIVGSHSRANLRDGVCAVDDKRSRIALARVDDDRIAVTERVDLQDDTVDGRARGAWTTDGCRARFTTHAPGADALCAAIGAAEAAAARGEADGCARSVNIEGAVGVDGKLWLGLRAPVLDGGAALLRVATLGRDGPTFDGVATLTLPAPLTGYGIRDLASAPDGVAALVGPAPDAAETQPDFAIVQWPSAALTPGATLTPADRTPVPHFAEGLRIDAGHATLLFDGDAPSKSDRRDGAACRAPSRQLVLPIVDPDRP